IPRHVELTDAVRRAAGLKTAPVARAALTEALTLPGEVAADPDRLARVSSPAAGRIDAVHFREGEPVKKGDALVVVRVPELAKARAALRANEAKAKAARANAARLRALLDQRLAAEQEVVNAETEAQALELDARSTAEQLGALGAGASGAFAVTLRSPIDGLVIARSAVVGQPASADQVLGTVADLSEVWFLARIFEKDLGKLATGARADVHLNAYADEHFFGTVEYIGQQIDPVARTVTARVRLKNERGRLRIGLFGTCQVAAGTAAETEARLVVDEASVTEIGDKKVVFVEERPGHYEVHPVTLGREALGKIEVLAGLREGEAVVTDGVFTLKSIVLKGSFGEHD
ncbi:MAG TPA: efflux RND transporter periplasmic adaptor subunit, partial [Polyangiaceae bacterium]|nr:efflux RND transporter periplasmic adaptor subunit [Polyangiaceae bacterium]